MLLEQSVDNGSGSSIYINDFDKAPKPFAKDLPSTLQIITRDAKVKYDFNPNRIACYNPSISIITKLLGQTIITKNNRLNMFSPSARNSFAGDRRSKQFHPKFTKLPMGQT